MATEHQEVINHGTDVMNNEFKKLMINNKELKKENEKLKETQEEIKKEMKIMYDIIMNDENNECTMSKDQPVISMVKFNIGLMLEKFKTMSKMLKDSDDEIEQLKFSLEATEEPTSPTQDLTGLVFDIKDKLSDGEYKNIMDKLQIENKKSKIPKYVKLYCITGYNNIHQHTNSSDYKTNIMSINYTWDVQEEKEISDEEVDIKRIDVSMNMKGKSEIYEIVPYDELDGFYICSKYSKIRLNNEGEMMSDIKVGNIINEPPCCWNNTQEIFIINELIY